jgi:hypothetical protein
MLAVEETALLCSLPKLALAEQVETQEHLTLVIQTQVLFLKTLP